MTEKFMGNQKVPTLKKFLCKPYSKMIESSKILKAKEELHAEFFDEQNAAYDALAKKILSGKTAAESTLKPRENQLEDIRSLMETLNFTSKQAMDALKIPADKQAEYDSLI